MKYMRALPALLVLSACSGGSGDSSAGGDQAEDPVVVDYPIAFVRRQLGFEDDGALVEDDIYSPADFNPGAQLVMKDRATPSAPETVLTAGLFDGDYDVKDLNTSADGQRLVFSMRAPEIEGADDDEQPTWNIWLYDRESRELRRVIESDLIAEEGQDIAPAFLPDGRIVFSSTRQRRSRALLLDDNKPQFSSLSENQRNEAFVLHAMEADGSAIRQISFNQSHDLHPTVLNDGRILFNRWDNMGGVDNLSLYTIEPDGTDLAFNYGYHSQQTGTAQTDAAFVRPRQMPDGRLLITLRAPAGTSYGGDLVAIDSANHTEAYSLPEGEGEVVGQESIAVEEVITDGSLSPHGLFAAAWPFYDGTSRLLVSWSECRVLEAETGLPRPCTDEWLSQEEVVPADPIYGLWIYDYAEGTQLPIVVAEEGEMISEGVTLEPRTEPAYLPEPIAGVDLDSELVQDGVGILDIRSVYDFDGVDMLAGEGGAGIPNLADPDITPAELRPARFLRVAKAVGIPDDDILDFDRSAFGRNRAHGMRDILGYTPIQPDGSVRVKLPADMPLAISVVDADGRRIVGRHRSWLQLRAGEVRTCNGCHTGDSEVPHGRPDKEPASAWAGAPTSGVPFPNTEPALVAEIGETMAQLLARIAGETQLERDISFSDLWTDPAVRAKDPSSSIAYADLQTPLPIAATCLDDWAGCRSVIHYPQHIQPLWERTREVLDAGGNLIEDRTCTVCHSNRDAAGMLRIPAGQLDLTAAASAANADWMTSYVELLFDNPTEELVDGALSPILVQERDDNGNLVFETDEDGNLILDSDGNPIPVMVTVDVDRLMGDAANGSRFFEMFAPGAAHADYLDPAELRLISEWLDIGAQYYNDPFAAPVN
ncbi:WD40-like Beta Propeller Repeat [Microbulbifer donghaiensis]|uniref:WD40-like Beta Propeller Repeat n=1 Tax=Microbulbifer donghaiensis TaxID=494016 RepID=A0A1M5A0L3_9GAMM|nr:PD40 domain-containing protein [Microbulbifer donghaiensis]SHF23647.1 WD40-like Beta Propeller Repeat [Microbulbifer donghaiensis]